MQRTLVRSLTSELRSHVQCGMAEKLTTRSTKLLVLHLCLGSTLLSLSSRVRVVNFSHLIW